MPRHPPYALKNLNTQNDHNKSQTNNQEPKRLSIIRQRCSRPLCRSQKTTGPTTTHHLARGGDRGPTLQRPQTLTLPLPLSPNNMPNPPTPPHRPFHTP